LIRDCHADSLFDCLFSGFGHGGRGDVRSQKAEEILGLLERRSGGHDSLGYPATEGTPPKRKDLTELCFMINTLESNKSKH
jgi:hypothetical protein